MIRMRLAMARLLMILMRMMMRTDVICCWSVLSVVVTFVAVLS